MNQRTDVAIIGAGIAGLAAARECYALGVDDLMVVEAAPDEGGRIWTEPATQAAGGAERLHSAALLPVLKSLGLEAVPYDESTGVYVFQQYDSPELIRDEAGEGSVDNIINRMQALIRNKRFPAMSIEDFINSGKLYREDPGLAKDISRIRNLLLHALQAEMGASPELMSIRCLLEGSAFDNKNYNVTGGLRQLPRQMAAGLPITYNNPVSAIQWRRGQVELHTKNGRIDAKKAILALPLGLLQNGRPAILPTLPARNTEAIRRIGNGMVCKMMAVFDRPVWPEDMTLIRTDIPEAPLLWPNTGNANALTCFMGGAPSLRMQRLTEQDAANITIENLCRIFGQKIRSRVTSVVRKAWGKEEYTMTGYSVLYKQSDGAREIMAEIIEGTLGIATEACANSIHPETPTTVCGGYFSGVETARKLLAS